jgi:hypothetical protein
MLSGFWKQAIWAASLAALALAVLSFLAPQDSQGKPRKKAATATRAAEKKTPQDRSDRESGTAETEPAGLEQATFGAGCFWCSEAVFQQIKGVRSAISGYSACP